MRVLEGAVDAGSIEGIITSVEGSEEVLVVRYGDPVQVRRAGGSAPYPLAFHDKEVRLKAGSWILCSPGGKVEILWPRGTSMVLSGRTTGLVGSPSRGEPTFAFVEVENAILNLRPGDQVKLLGCALVSADAGPLAVERLDSGVLRVENQSKAEGRVLFREADFRLDPGQEIHLPLLSAGGEPKGVSTVTRRYGEQGLVVELGGAAEILPHPEGAWVHAVGEHEIQGMGLQVQLGEGERLLVRGVDMGDFVAPLPVVEPAVEEEAVPVPVPEPVEDPVVPEDDWVPVEGPDVGGGLVGGTPQE